MTELAIPQDLWHGSYIGQLSEVINNLLINAQQSMPQGGTINIVAENHTVNEIRRLPIAAGRYVNHNQGPWRGHTVKPAEQNIRSVLQHQAAGNRPGLTVAYSIIKKHAGHIEISSDVGAGTVVQIYLPASNKSAVESAQPMQELKHGNGRILLMDDEEFLLDAIGKILGSLGYSVATARNGRDAVAFTFRHGFPTSRLTPLSWT